MSDATAPQPKKHKPNDLERFRDFVIFFLAWAIPVAGYVMGAILTVWGLRSLAGFLFWHEGIHLEALWTLGGPLFILIESGAEPHGRKYLAQAWKNLIHRRNDLPPL